MMVKSIVSFPSSIAIRTVVLIVSIVVILCVIGGAIAIAVIVSKNPNIFNKKIFVSNAKISLYRSIAADELDKYFDEMKTLADLDQSLNRKFRKSFPQLHVKTVIVHLDRQPIVLPQNGSTAVNQCKPNSTQQPSLITLNATAYFTSNVSGSEIRIALTNYTEQITLEGCDGKPSSGPAYILIDQSTFMDSVFTDLTEATVLRQVSSFGDPPIKPNESTSPPGYNTTEPITSTLFNHSSTYTMIANASIPSTPRYNTTESSTSTLSNHSAMN